MAANSKLNPNALEFFPSPRPLHPPPFIYLPPQPSSGHLHPPAEAASSSGGRSRGGRRRYYTKRRINQSWRHKNDGSESGHCNRRKNAVNSSRFHHPVLTVDETSDSQRTTCMIRNIPNRYTRKLLMEFLDEHCKRENEWENEKSSAYDFLYLPIDFHYKANKGYAFVNFTKPEALCKFKRAVHNKGWPLFSSNKICCIAYARLQGKEELVRHFERSTFDCDNDDYLPVVFSPARDGSADSVDQKVIGKRGKLN